MVEAVKRSLASAERVSADDKEVASRARDSTAANMAATVFVVDTWHQKTAGAMQHQAVAKHGIALVLLPSSNKALASMMPPLATPMAMLSSPTCPTTYAAVVFSTMGGGPHGTSFALAPSP
jgi:hypothetical protein